MALSPPLADAPPKKTCLINCEKAEFANSHKLVNKTGTANPQIYDNEVLKTSFNPFDNDNNDSPAKEKAVIITPLLCFVRKASPANSPAQTIHFIPI